MCKSKLIVTFVLQSTDLSLELEFCLKKEILKWFLTALWNTQLDGISVAELKECTTEQP